MSEGIEIKEVNFEKKDEHYFMENVSLDLIPNYQSQGH